MPIPHSAIRERLDVAVKHVQSVTLIRKAPKQLAENIARWDFQQHDFDSLPQTFSVKGDS